MSYVSEIAERVPTRGLEARTRGMLNAVSSCMQVTLNDDDLRFLRTHLAKHIESVEREAARTDKHELQHALACDVKRLREIEALLQ